MCRHAIPSAAVILLAAGVEAQQPFRNLGFESATLTPIPAGQFGGSVPISQALPGWSGFVGTQEVASVLQNNFTLGGASISMLGPNWPHAAFGIIDGQYTVLLQAGGVTAGTVDVSISQTGLIPAGTESILLKTFGADPSAFSLSFGGEYIPMVPLFVATNYTLYGGDVSQFAGQSGKLGLSTRVDARIGAENLVLDSIVSSPQVIPEPSTVALLAAGLSLLGCRYLSRQKLPGVEAESSVAVAK